MVATAQTIAVLYFNSINDNVSGNRKRRNPVILFISVCSIANLFSKIQPNTIFATFIVAIIAIHTQIQYGRVIAGNNLIKATTTKIKSATESNFEPSSVAE